jgi:hypothetical protein
LRELKSQLFQSQGPEKRSQRLQGKSNRVRGLFLPLAVSPRPLGRLALGSITRHARSVTLDRHAITLAPVTLGELLLRCATSASSSPIRAVAPVAICLPVSNELAEPRNLGLLEIRLDLADAIWLVSATGTHRELATDVRPHVHLRYPP